MERRPNNNNNKNKMSSDTGLFPDPKTSTYTNEHPAYALEEHATLYLFKSENAWIGMVQNLTKPDVWQQDRSSLCY